MRVNTVRTSIFGAAALVLGLSLSHGQGTPSLAKQRTITVGGKSYVLTSRLKSILVGDFFYNYDHHKNASPQNLIATLQRLGGVEGWTVDVTTDGNAVTAAKLKGYQVFFANYISSWASSNGFPTANRTAVQDFVENQGGGVFIQHSSGDSRAGNNWPWFYNTAHPVEYTGESSRITISAPVFIPQAAKASPIMEGISFAGKDTVIWPQGEWHTFNKIITDIHPEATVLLKMDAVHCTKGGTGTNCGSAYNYSVPGGYPATWTFPDKKGNIGYFMEAHDLVTMQAMTQAVWDKFYRQFMYYVAGYDTVAVSTALKPRNADLNFALDGSGITFHPSDQPGVFINKPGYHMVTLFDMAGHKVKEIKGNQYPVDYDLSADFKGVKAGVYVMRVALANGRVGSKRFFVN